MIVSRTYISYSHLIFIRSQGYWKFLKFILFPHDEK